MAAKGRPTDRANAGESEGGKEALFKRDIPPSFLPPPPLSLSPQWRLRQSLSLSLSLQGRRGLFLSPPSFFQGCARAGREAPSEEEDRPPTVGARGGREPLSRSLGPQLWKREKIDKRWREPPLCYVDVLVVNYEVKGDER